MSKLEISTTVPLAYKRILVLSLPIIFANVTLPIQGLIDVAIIGHLDSPDYLSAIGLAAQWFALLFVSFNFLQYASSGLAAQAQGKKDSGKLKRVLLRALLIAAVIGALLVVLQWVWLQLGVMFFSPETPVRELFAQYYAVRIWGAPFELANYAFIGWFAGQGRAAAVFRQQLSISLSNIVFNVLFVVVLQWDVVGVALGTLLANFLGFIYAIYLAKTALQRQNEVFFSIDWQALLRRAEMIKLMSLNRDILIRTTILTLSFAWVMRLSAQQGELILAANVILLQLVHLSALAIDGVAVTTESLVGQAYGQRQIAQVRHIVYRTTLTSLLIAFAISLIFFCIQPLFLRLMTSIDAVAVTAGQYYVFAALAPLASVLAYQFDGVMFGLTANTAIRNGMLLVAICFFPVSFVLPLFWGNIGVWLALYWFFLLRGGIFYWQFRRVHGDESG